MNTAILLLIALAPLTALKNNPAKLLEAARQKVNSYSCLQYTYQAHWPNPVGKIDTLVGTSTFRHHKNQYFDYDYAVTGKTYDFVYEDNQFKSINHEDRTVLLYSPEDMGENQRLIRENILTSSSPLTLLNATSWTYVQDTVIHDGTFADYRIIEMDTTIDANHVYVEKHLFIGHADSLLGRYERRAFLNGNSSQRIVYQYSAYKFDVPKERILYELPQGYKSMKYGDREQLTLLKAGQQAPDFNATDIDGGKVSLTSLRGKKILLFFSVINCGYCMLAVKHVNREGYQLPEDLTAIYVNPDDNKSEVTDYRTKIKIPFPAIADAKEISRFYGVTGYPTFFLINERGVIEKVQEGYRPEFLDELRE